MQPTTPFAPPPQEFEVTDRQHRAYILRRKGMTLDAIGADLGIRKSAVCRLLKRVVDKGALHGHFIGPAKKRVIKRSGGVEFL